MSTSIRMPPTTGKVVKIHRQSGFYVNEGEPIVDVQLSETHRLTLRAPFEGKIMLCREVGYLLKGNERVVEITSVGRPTWEVFVAYRRKDAPGHAGRIGERLIGYFGAGQIFKDIESLPPGVDFVDFIKAKLQLAFVVVVIIGPGWADDQRLHGPEDLHREEIRTALERGLHIVPVLVHGATMPPAEQVPEDIRPFLRRQAVEVTDTRWDYDIGVLIKSVEGALMESPRRKRFLAQVPPWDYTGGWQWVQDDAPPGDEPFDYNRMVELQREAAPPPAEPHGHGRPHEKGRLIFAALPANSNLLMSVWPQRGTFHGHSLPPELYRPRSLASSRRPVDVRYRRRA